MKKIIFLLIATSLFFSSCGSSKRSKSFDSAKKTSVHKKSNKKIKSIISYAKTFNGTKYKYGGTTRRGMDCSGLIYTSFKKENVPLPRTSRSMASKGKPVSLKRISPGDLLFFRTNKNKKVINHVGLVVASGKNIQFIHASVSKGVTISSLNERYWNSCFVGARRIL
ncbi:C40 family peptidase [Aquimarina hainanensis]|uniref:C40 family peptidase n=1 Tax=Aquimarina hainanensis TaxID=1578017 RepID=A0ABW5N529_9FLAO